MDNNSLSHTKWTCKYHIVFAPKFRRKVIYKQIRADIGHILSELCKRKGVEIIAAECMPYLYFKYACLSNIIKELFPFKYPIISDTLYFGGILTNI